MTNEFRADSTSALAIAIVLTAVWVLMHKRARHYLLAEFLLFIEALVFFIESAWLLFCQVVSVFVRFRNDYRARRNELYGQVANYE